MVARAYAPRGDRSPTVESGPVFANLLAPYTFDTWMREKCSACDFVGAGVIHSKLKTQLLSTNADVWARNRTQKQHESCTVGTLIGPPVSERGRAVLPDKAAGLSCAQIGLRRVRASLLGG